MSTSKQKHIHLSAIVPEELADSRLDRALVVLFPDYSRGRLQSWIKAGDVQVDTKILKANHKVVANQSIVIDATLEIQNHWEAQDIELNIVYEDEAIIVVNKPAGLVVHPGAGNPDKTMINALLHHDPDLNALPRAGIIHRLDKNTSGLLVVPRTLEAHTKLVTELQAREFKREYETIVSGVMTAGGTVDAPLGRHNRDRKRMAVIESGKVAITHYRVIKRFRAHTHVRVNLETGRTHQIRVHMAHIKHPVVGDAVYGGRLKIPAGVSPELHESLQHFSRQALHARRLGITHPTTGESIEWEAPLPDDMQQLLALLEDDLISHTAT